MNEKKTYLTQHFTLEEMCKSGSHPEIKNVPNETQRENLERVAVWLEGLRTLYNARYPNKDGEPTPLIINSGYRCAMLNKVVGGQERSNHLSGCAADIHCPGKDANERAKMALRYATLLLELANIRREKFDEVIIERKGTTWWVHFAVRPDVNRSHVTVINKSR